MANVGNWILETSPTTGTGDIVLTGAQIGFARFRDALPSGPVWYVIEDGTQKEAGIGTFNGADTIARTTVQATLVGGTYTDDTPSPINMSGTALVACTFNSMAYRELFNHTLSTDDPHDIQAAQVVYDPSSDPVSVQTELQGVLIDHAESIEERISSMSGITSGGVLTGGGVTFSVSAGSGAVFDSYTDPNDTSVTEVTWLDQNNISLNFGGETFGSTKIFMTSAGNVLQVTGAILPSQYREYIFLGIVYFFDSVITEVTNAPSVLKQTATDLYDNLRRDIAVGGNSVQPVTGQLQVWVQSGSVFYPGVNWVNDRTDPNNFPTSQQGDETTPILFYPMTQDGAFAAPTSVIPEAYNPTGNTVVDLGGDDATIHRLFSLGIQDGTRIFILLYGQFEYNNANEARSSIGVDDNGTIFPPPLQQEVYQLAHIGVSNNAPDFDDIDDAWIVSIVSSASSSTSGSSSDHTGLSNREVPDQHPIEAIGTPLGEQLRDTLDAKVRWLNEWVQQEYQPNDMVRDGSWAMIANKVTEERAGPQPIGEPRNLFTGLLVDSSVLAKQVIFGARYSPTEGGYLNGYRLNVVTGAEYSVYRVNDPLGAAQVSEVASFTAVSTGWKELAITPDIVGTGAVFDLIAIVDEPDPIPTGFSGNWNYTTPQNATPPANGEAVQANSSSETLSVSKTDNDAVDRTAELAVLTVGDVINSGTLRYLIQAVVDQGAYLSFTVAPQIQSAPDGVREFTFNTVTATPIPYGVDADFYLSNPNIQGIFGADTQYSDITPDDNAYGIDIIVQEASVSEDWDLLAYSGGSASGGGESGGSSSPIYKQRIQYTNVEGQSVFPVLYDEGYLEVNLNGVLLDPTQYTAENGTTCTLNDPIASVLDVLDLIGYAQNNDVANAIRIKTEYTSVAGQTEFSVPSGYSIGNAYVNGVMMASADYTFDVSTGTLTLVEPIQSDSDVLTVEGYGEANVTDDAAFRQQLDVYSTEESDAGNFNYLINGGFDIWQRGDNFTLTGVAGPLYTADRWAVNYSDAANSISVNRVAAASGNIPYLSTNNVVSTGGNFFEQKIEAVSSLRGKTVSVGFYANTNVPQTMNVQLYSNINGSGDTIISSDPVSIVGTPLVDSFFTVQVTIPDYLDEPILADDYIMLRFEMTVSGIVNLGLVQLNSGSIAKPFIYTPVGETLALCQRYYERWGRSANSTANRQISGYSGAGTNCVMPIPWHVPKRVDPVVTLNGTWALTNASGLDAVNGSTDGFLLVYTTASLGDFTVRTASSSDYVEADAEL